MKTYDLIRERDLQIKWAMEHYDRKDLKEQLHEKYGLTEITENNIIKHARHNIHSSTIAKPVADWRYDLLKTYTSILSNGSNYEKIRACDAIRKMLDLDIVPIKTDKNVYDIEMIDVPDVDVEKDIKERMAAIEIESSDTTE